MAVTSPVLLSIATSAPSSTGGCSRVTVAVPASLSTFTRSTSTRSPTLTRSAGDILRVHWIDALVSSAVNGPILTRAVPSATAVTTAGTMSPSAIG
jgi:hypothetical protein